MVSSALAQVNDVFPDPAYTERIAQWLAEGIDIDEDGQFIERSTVTYNTVTDRAFTVLAAKLKRPELLDPVRRNLQAMMYLLHPDGEVVTEVSKRQDQFVRGTMAGYWFPLNYLAVHDGDRQFAALARGLGPEPARLSALLEYPELNGPLPQAAALPEDYEKWFGAVGLARIRRGKWDATMVLKENSRFFSARNGGAVINAVRFATSFFGKGQFVPDACVKEDAKYIFRQSLSAPVLPAARAGAESGLQKLGNVALPAPPDAGVQARAVGDGDRNRRAASSFACSRTELRACRSRSKSVCAKAANWKAAAPRRTSPTRGSWRKISRLTVWVATRCASVPERQGTYSRNSAAPSQSCRGRACISRAIRPSTRPSGSSSRECDNSKRFAVALYVNTFFEKRVEQLFDLRRTA